MKSKISITCLLLVLVPILVSAVEIPAGVIFVGVKNSTSDIFLWQPDGGSGSIKPLTKTPEKEGNAQWWPHRKLILASREIEENRYGLVAIDSELKTVWVAEDPIGSLGWPVPSPWDDRILCVRECGNGMVQPGMIVYPDGIFEPFDFNGLSGGQLAWLAPDRVQLSRVTENGFAITHRDLSTNEEKIMVSGGNNWQSYVNAAAGVNLFVRRVGQIGSIFRLSKNSSDQWDYENLTNARTYDWQPGLSADGKTLIFRSLRNGLFVTVVRGLAESAEKEKILPITGFSQIFFPSILEPETVSSLMQADLH